MSSPRPVLALDIGGTKLAAAVVDAAGRVDGLTVEPTRPHEGWQVITRRLFDMGRKALHASGGGTPGVVGIACGGPLDASSGVLLSPPNLPGWVKVPIGPMATQAFGVPFALENDAAAGALAEHRFGAGRGVASMLYLTISTGVGGGAIVDGSLLRGATGNGGEFGHLTVQRGGRLCGCGRRGCLEAYASGTAIAQQAAQALAKEDITAADVARAAATGDPAAGAIWAEAMDALGGAVTDLVNVFEPNVVVLGGGVTRSGALLFDPVREIVAREAISPAAGAVQIVPAGLGDLVGVAGAGIVGQMRLERMECGNTPEEAR